MSKTELKIIKPSNLYYLLAYALGIQPNKNTPSGIEDFSHYEDLLSFILAHCLESCLRKGLFREYVQNHEITSSPHGKIVISESISKNTFATNRLSCDYDDFDVNVYSNMAIKATLYHMLKISTLDNKVSNRLKQIKRSLPRIANIPIRSIVWGKVTYNGNDNDYKMALHICRLYHYQNILSDGDKGPKRRSFINEDREFELFEKFVIGFFRINHKTIFEKTRKLDWVTLEGVSYQRLPSMEMDLLLKNRNKMMIIDTKCYRSIMGTKMGAENYHSTNLYQIYTYVNNMKKQNPSDLVEGMLLYAKSGEEEYTDKFDFSGEITIHIRTLDLNGDWSTIKEQLDEIAAMLN